jgi:hypothetical protein
MNFPAIGRDDLPAASTGNTHHLRPVHPARSVSVSPRRDSAPELEAATEDDLVRQLAERARTERLKRQRIRREAVLQPLQQLKNLRATYPEPPALTVPPHLPTVGAGRYLTSGSPRSP